KKLTFTTFIYIIITIKTMEGLTFTYELFNFINELFIIIDKDFTVLFSNTKAQQFFNSNISSLISNNDEIKKLVSSLAHNEQIINHHITIKINKRVRHFKLNAIPIQHNGINLYALILNDTSRLFTLYKHQKELINQIKKIHFDRLESLKQLADSIAHEVRNPLVSIGGYANLLIRKCEEGIDHTEAKKFLTYIIENAERLNYLTQQIEELGDFKRAELYPYDIVNFIGKLKDDLIAIANHYSKELNITLESHEPFLMYIDLDKLSFAFIRLVEFVARHSTSKITLRCFSTPYEFIVLVKFMTDTLQHEDLPYIFDPFYTTRSNVETFNICIAQRIIMLHGGLITPVLKENRMQFRIILPKDKRLS
ncbi:MAG: histidine kinase dimerization/phospho-acceptor domain-containing protein, partial [Spirochaetota bacterium]